MLVTAPLGTLVKATTCAVASLVVLACERPAERAAERLAESAIERQGRHSDITIDRESGSIVVHLKGAVKPQRWPVDVPFFDEARRAKAGEVREGAQRLTISGGGDAEKMRSFYRDHLAADGWNVEERAGALHATRDNRELVVRFESRDSLRGARAVLDVRSKDA